MEGVEPVSFKMNLQDALPEVFLSYKKMSGENRSIPE